MRLAIFAAIVTAGLPPGTEPGRRPASRPGPPAIRVVKTYEQLRRQPVVELPGGAKVQLGLEAAQCPRYGGVLLYCLAGGFVLPRNVTAPPADVLGPVRVEVAAEGMKFTQHGHGQWIRKDGPGARDLRNCKALFAKAIVAWGAGRHRVSVKDANGREVAFANLTAAKDKHHPWTPLLRDKYRPPDREAPRGGRVPDWYVENGPNGPAVPYWDPMAVLRIVEGTEPGGRRQEKFLHRQRLPACLPRGTHPGLRAKVATDAHSIVLTITAAGDIYTCRPRDRFLTRWWVNGKPLVPVPPKAVSIQGNGLVTRGRKLRLHLLLDAARLGAKTGDRVRLQLLYCHRGWEWSFAPARLANARLNDFLDLRVPSMREGQEPCPVLQRYGILLAEPVEFVLK